MARFILLVLIFGILLWGVSTVMCFVPAVFMVDTHRNFIEIFWLFVACAIVGPIAFLIITGPTFVISLILGAAVFTHAGTGG